MSGIIDFNMTRQHFRSELFEARPYLWRSCFDDSKYGWSLINEALDLQDPTRELIKVLCDGRIEPELYVEEYIDVGIRRRRIVKERLYGLLGDGATVVINRIELVSLPVREICHQIGRFVGAQTSSNAYASFGEKTATNVHWDTHDVFVVQIGGRKHWRIYEPTHPLPISSQISNDRKGEVPDAPVLDCVLEAGDMLYVPRGWWHRVVPVPDSETLHLTVAVHTPLILDYLVWASASVLPNFVQLRHSLLGEESDEARVADAASVIAAALSDPATLESFYSRSHQRERVVSPFDIENLVGAERGPLPSDTEAMINSRHAGSGTPETIINGSKRELRETHRDLVEALTEGIVSDVSSLRKRFSTLSPNTLDAALLDLARADLIRLRFPHTAPVHDRESLDA